MSRNRDEADLIVEVGGIANLGAGILVKTATNTYVQRSVTVTTDELVVQHGNGLSGSLILGLANPCKAPGRMDVHALLEKATIAATAATGTINFDVNTQAVLYYTSNAAANWTLNIRGSGSASLDSLMATGDSLTIVHFVTQGGTPYYNSAVTIDSGANTPKWAGGSAPAAGNANSVDVYVYTVFKTATATFTTFASLTKFA